MGHYASEMMPPREPKDWEKAGFHQEVESYRVSCGTCGAILGINDWRKHQRWHDLTNTRPARTRR